VKINGLDIAWPPPLLVCVELGNFNPLEHDVTVLLFIVADAVIFPKFENHVHGPL
jgi:hypothetical protein